MKLYGNNTEREMYDNLADLYAIIKTTEAVEKAHLRDAIGGDECVARARFARVSVRARVVLCGVRVRVC